MADENGLPLVSVVMPVRNEADFIRRSLGAVLSQDYPPSRLEVLVVDGMSDDGTPDLVHRIAAEHADREVDVLPNPAGIVPQALNLALDRVTGDVVIRVDGHCVIPHDYVRRCVRLLRETGAACAGGCVETVGETRAARAIAVAQSSRFGVGGVAFRVGASRGGPVDTVAFGAYRREVFDRVGRFLPDLVRNQDDEFNYRLNRAGETVWLDPSIRVTYYSRATLRALWRQYFQYGFYKIRVMREHGLMSIRHLVPAAFVLMLLAGTISSLATWHVAPLALTAGTYVVVDVAVASVIGNQRQAPVHVIATAFATIHLAYGFGFLWGILRWHRTGRAPEALR